MLCPACSVILYEKVTLYSFNNEEYTYEFSMGINYFKGKNSSGKTEFYKFMDFMFGSSEDIRKKPWYKNTLKMASMEMQVDNITYVLTRSYDPEQNYLLKLPTLKMGFAP